MSVDEAGAARLGADGRKAAAAGAAITGPSPLGDRRAGGPAPRRAGHTMLRVWAAALML